MMPIWKLLLGIYSPSRVFICKHRRLLFGRRCIDCGLTFPPKGR